MTSFKSEIYHLTSSKMFLHKVIKIGILRWLGHF